MVRVYNTCPYNLCSIQCIGSPPSYHQTGLDFYLTIMSVLLPLLDITERLHVCSGATSFHPHKLEQSMILVMYMYVDLPLSMYA